MTKSVKEKMSAINWQDDNEIIEFYESNPIYFDNFSELTNEESLLEILRGKFAYCQALINKNHNSKALPILEHVNIIVNKLKDHQEFNEINNKYLYTEAVTYHRLRRYQEAHENLKELLEKDPDNDHYKHWFENNKVNLTGKKSNIYGYIGFGILLLSLFIEPILKRELSIYWTYFAGALMIGGFGYPYIDKFLKKLK